MSDHLTVFFEQTGHHQPEQICGQDCLTIRVGREPAQSEKHKEEKLDFRLTHVAIKSLEEPAREAWSEAQRQCRYYAE